MEVKLNCGDKITIPEGCKAKIEDGIITVDGCTPTYQDGDIIHCETSFDCGAHEWIAIVHRQELEYLINTHVTLFIKSLFENEIGRLHIPDCQNVEHDIRLATEEEKQILFDELEKKEYAWNAKEKKIEKLLPRVKKGHTYFVLDEYQYIVCMTDSRDHISNDYHLSGNYFTTQKEAEEYADKIRELFAERRKI